MNNRFNINEEEKNRIRGLHGMQVINEQTTTDGDQVAAETEVTMYQGIPSNRLHPFVLKNLKKQHQTSAIDMIKIAMGCYEGTGNWMEPLTPSSLTLGECGPHSLCGADWGLGVGEYREGAGTGDMVYTSGNFKRKKFNICKMNTMQDLKKAVPYMEQVDEMVDAFVARMGPPINLTNSENGGSELQDAREVALKWEKVGDKYKLVKA